MGYLYCVCITRQTYFNFFTCFFKVRPEVSVSGASNLIREGDIVTLTCKIIQGRPKPQITWLKNNLSQGHNTSLSFNKITKEDAGLYTCKANNSGGISTENIYISVQGKFSALKLHFKSFSCVTCGRMDQGLIAVGLNAGQDLLCCLLGKEIPPSSRRVFLLKSLSFFNINFKISNCISILHICTAG